jgi:hypothetical protein
LNGPRLDNNKVAIAVALDVPVAAPRQIDSKEPGEEAEALFSLALVAFQRGQRNASDYLAVTKREKNPPDRLRSAEINRAPRSH